MARVIERDLGWNDILKQLKIMEKKPFTKIGLLARTSKKPKTSTQIIDGKKTKETNPQTTVLDVGLANEFGTEKIPERSFVRSTHDQNSGHWMGIIDAAIIRIYLGRETVKRALNIVGLKATSDMKLKIKNGDPKWPPNADETIKRKGSSKPLIDTAQMLNSIAHTVVIKGKDDIANQ